MRGHVEVEIALVLNRRVHTLSNCRNRLSALVCVCNSVCARECVSVLVSNEKLGVGEEYVCKFLEKVQKSNINCELQIFVYLKKNKLNSKYK